jgi:hypothetical protein
MLVWVTCHDHSDLRTTAKHGILARTGPSCRDNAPNPTGAERDYGGEADAGRQYPWQ